MYTPLLSCVKIAPSPIHGNGIFARQSLPNEVSLGLSHIYDESFPDNLIRTPLGGFINHSDEPNCELYRLGRFLFVQAMRKIDAGEEITLKYGRTKTLFEAPVA